MRGKLETESAAYCQGNMRAIALSAAFVPLMQMLIAEADKFITHLPQGYETIVRETKQKLSGGQRQRIAIARAVSKNLAMPIVLMSWNTDN